jgi:hypothetical protein
MKTKTKFFLFIIASSITLVLLGIVCLAIHFRSHYVERPISSFFLQQLHAASATNTWPTEAKEVALKLVGSDLFPPGRPPLRIAETDAIITGQSSDYCKVHVLEGFFDNKANALIATDDCISLRREGSVWIPYFRKVSWQTKNRPGWRNDPL